jgi:phage shock protein A
MWVDNRQIREQDLQAYVNEQRQIARNCGCEAMAKYWTASIHKYEDKITTLKKELANVRRQYSRLRNKVNKERQING